MKPLKVLIAGGGIGGLTAALCLARSGIDVDVFELAPAFGEVGAGIQLSPNCSRVLHAVGLEAVLRAVAFLPQATQFRDWATGEIISETALGPHMQQRYGAPYYHIHRGDLLKILVEAASQVPGIRLHLSARAIDFSQTSSSATLRTEGGVFSGELLVGADGIHSKIRELLWGEEPPRFTGNVAWRALVPADRLEAGLVRPMSTAWWGPHKHFVHYYVRGGALVNCVCVVEKTGWEVESWTERGLRAELQADFSGWHQNIQSLIRQVDPDSLFKWALFDRPPMARWGQERVTLLGDACHPTLPFMAQGAAMAIEDAAVLASCIAQGYDVPASLQQYESLRRERTASIQNGSRRNATLFHLSGAEAEQRNRAMRNSGARPLDAIYGYDALLAATTSAAAGAMSNSGSS